MLWSCADHVYRVDHMQNGSQSTPTLCQKFAMAIADTPLPVCFLRVIRSPKLKHYFYFLISLVSRLFALGDTLPLTKELGHSIEYCRAFKEKVQDLLDTKAINFGLVGQI